MDRYLTLEEMAEELRVTKATVLKLLQKKRLVGIEITPGHYRLLDPAPALRERLLTAPIERFPFLAPREVAEVLGLKFEALRHEIRIGRAKPARIEGGPSFRVFTPKQVRELAAAREKLRGRGKFNYSASIAKWLRGYLAQDADVTAEGIQAMLDQAVKIPEPKRSQTIVEIWGLIGKLDEILKECG
jgi:excisionase family DNA binding protein